MTQGWERGPWKDPIVGVWRGVGSVVAQCIPWGFEVGSVGYIGLGLVCGNLSEGESMSSRLSILSLSGAEARRSDDG